MGCSFEHAIHLRGHLQVEELVGRHVLRVDDVDVEQRLALGHRVQLQPVVRSVPGDRRRLALGVPRSRRRVKRAVQEAPVVVVLAAPGECALIALVDARFPSRAQPLVGRAIAAGGIVRTALRKVHVRPPEAALALVAAAERLSAVAKRRGAKVVGRRHRRRVCGRRDGRGQPRQQRTGPNDVHHADGVHL